MCLLILVTGVDSDHPILVASNRDEQRDRPAAPPGLFVGERHRMLSPRDRRAGGTWLAVGDDGGFAGLTNLAGVPVPDGAATRGDLPHEAIDAGGVDAGAERIRQLVASRPYGGFQIAISDGARTRVLAHAGGGRLEEHELAGGSLVISNEHRLGELHLPGLAAACEPGLSVDERLATMAALLLDQGEHSGHRILKLGGDYGTVSSSLIAVPGEPLSAGLVWRYAAGSPDQAPYRNYGNLARRLLPD